MHLHPNQIEALKYSKITISSSIPAKTFLAIWNYLRSQKNLVFSSQMNSSAIVARREKSVSYHAKFLMLLLYKTTTILTLSTGQLKISSQSDFHLVSTYGTQTIPKLQNFVI